MSWELILKEIPFKIRDFRAIEKRAKKIWNDGGRKERLSNILVREVKKKYEKYVSLENLLEDFAKFNNLEMEEMMDVYPLMESLLQTERGAGKFEGFDKFTDSEILRQLEAFKDNLERAQNKKKLKDEPKTDTPPPPKVDSKTKTGKLDNFEDSFPKSANMFREWVKSTSFKNLNELMGLVGSPTIGNDETIGRLRKFIKEEDLSEDDKTALTAIADQMVKENNEKPRSNRRLSGNVVQARALGLEVGKDSRMRKTTLSIKYAGDKNESFRGKAKDFLNEFERLDLKDEAYYNNLNTREIFEYWVEQSGFTGSANKFVNLDPVEKSNYIKTVMRNIPEYPRNAKLAGILYTRVFKDREGGYIINEEQAPEEFAYFAQGLRDGITGGKGARTAFDFNILKKFNTNILPKLTDAIKSGVFVEEDGTVDFKLGPPISKLMKRLSKEQEDKREIISVIGDVIRGQNLSDKYQGSDKDTLAKIESDIREQLKEKVAGKTVASYLLTTFMQLYKSEGILSSILNTKTVIPVEYLKPQEPPKAQKKKEPEGQRIQVLQRGVYDETKKSLDNLLVVLGEEDEIIIKEDVGLILESLNKKQKQKVKAILNIADPTEYFGHDFLKLSELIRLLRTLGVVKGDKKLNKKILRYDEENVKVVKLAARLRKDYERLYNDLREMVYPKSGE